MAGEHDRLRYTSILDALEDGVYIVRRDFILEYMNKAMIKDFGEWRGNKCYQVLHEREEICPWCRAEEVFAGKKIRWEHPVPAVNKIYDLIEIPYEVSDGIISKLSICRDITERKRREERIRSSEEDYRRLFQLVGCGVYVSSKQGKFLNANPALLKMMGYESKEEFLEIDITNDLYVRPEDRLKFQEMIERDGRVIDYEVEFKRKDKTPIPVLMTSHIRCDVQGKVLGYEGIMVDQSERKQMEAQLREAHDFVNKIIRSSPNSIIATDLKGNIILWNQAAEEILGYKAEEVLGRHIDMVYPEGMAKKVMGMMRTPQFGGIGRLRSFPVVHVRRDGKIVEGTLSASIVYDREGREGFTVGIFVDLNERLEMERALRRTQEQLLQSEKLAAMGRLTSQIAHELNNPLYGIMNTLELMKTEISPQSKRRKILEMALSETVRLTDLLRKMLSFSKPDQEERQVSDVNTILDEILLLYEKQLRENNIKLVVEFSEHVGKVYASKNQLRQVFLNMISNAKDAMPDGGTLSVRTEGNPDQILIEISDTGSGIKEENLVRIFDAFFTTKDSIKGVGLGLSVCYGFIKEHGGDIRVESKWGIGTTFKITLPVHKEAT
jgi:PAS domain S-box-containing protein